MGTWTTRCRAVAGLVVAVVLTGCASVQEPEVEQAAAAFAGATEPAARCDLLAPATFATLVRDGGSCPEALEQATVGTGDVLSVEVWGQEAQARLADDILFLTRTEGGWRIAAAACSPSSEGRYDCQVEGA